MSASGLCMTMMTMMMTTNTTNKTGKKNQTDQIFSVKLLYFSPWPLSSSCPDNDPGRPQLPEIPLFFRALISPTVGSCNYRIGLPKRSAPCQVLRDLGPDPGIHGR